MHFQMTQALHRLKQQKPNEEAYHYRTRRRTWAEFADRSARLGAALQALGMQPGDRVGMLALNSDRYLEYMMGVWWGGGALNPVNTRWSAAEIAYSLDDCDTRILLVDEHFAPLANELRDRSKSLKTIIFAGDGIAPEGLPEYEQLLTQHQPAEDVERKDDDLAGVFYTGGTTGFPKGVMLSHTNLLSNALAYLLDLDYREDEVILAAAPIFHQAGMCILIRAFIRGCRSTIINGFDTLSVLEAIQQEKVTFTLLVPTMIQRLVDHPTIAEYDLSSLRRILYGASPISDGLLERTFKALPKVEFLQGYGMTETGGPYTVLPAFCHTPEGRNPDRLRSAGKPIWGMEIRIVDADGNLLPNGQIGEVIARGPGAMLGYWNRPEETASTTRNGWIHSGDAGYLDDKGYLFLVDRVKDMIVSGGENVYSCEVENAIGQHPAVASSAVIGIPSERWGEAVHAVIVLHPGQQLTAEELRAHCKTLIAGYKCPVSVEFRDSLPVTGAGKIQKNELREPYWKNLSRRVG
ncbi:long-chain-fatty-acid--CoA ligase [Pseudomonas aeruginosa]|uniref:long-chain-fatty-acid--CoA ligase n=1 Tax=Pseudomonas aeruginosa TaxID=287 RepID=UPI0031B6D50C